MLNEIHFNLYEIIIIIIINMDTCTNYNIILIIFE